MTRLARSYNLSISSLACGYSPIDKPGSSTFRATSEYIANAIEHTRWLGGHHILISFENKSDRAPQAVARTWVGELLKRLEPIASANEVACAYEIVWPALYHAPVNFWR